MEKVDVINEILKSRPELIGGNVYRKTPEEIIEILSLKEWEDPMYKNLLTVFVWNKSVNDIKRVFKMKFLKDKKYSHLLKPAIFSLPINKIIPMFKLFQSYGIDEYVTIKCLRRSLEDQEILLEFMQEKRREQRVIETRRKYNLEHIDSKEKVIDYNFVVYSKKMEKSLNPILNSSNKILKEKYNIDIKELREKWKESGLGARSK